MKYLVPVILLAVLVSEAAGRNDYNFPDKFFRSYDRYEPPAGATEVKLGFYMNQITIEDEERSVTMKTTMYIRQNWRDSRLAGHANDVYLSGERYELIWRPDTFFRNAISGGKRNNGLTVEQLTKVNTTGHVWHVMTIVGEFSCKPSPPQLPLGNTVCSIMIESYSHMTDVMYFAWLDSPVDVDPQILLEGKKQSYSMVDIVLFDCSANYTMGSFPCLEVRFILQPYTQCSQPQEVPDEESRKRK